MKLRNIWEVQDTWEWVHRVSFQEWTLKSGKEWKTNNIGKIGTWQCTFYDILQDFMMSFSWVLNINWMEKKTGATSIETIQVVYWNQSKWYENLTLIDPHPDTWDYSIETNGLTCSWGSTIGGLWHTKRSAMLEFENFFKNRSIAPQGCGALKGWEYYISFLWWKVVANMWHNNTLHSLD